MHRGIREPCQLKAIRCATFMVGLNEYLAAFPVAKAIDKIVDTELNENILNSMPNGLSNQLYVQGFDRETVTF